MTSTPEGDPADDASADAAVQPQTVLLGYWLYLASAALSIVSLIVAIATREVLRRSVQAALAAEHRQLSAADLNSTLTLVTVINVVFAVVWVFLFVFFARRMRSGAGWARTVLVIVTIVSFVNSGSGYGAGAAQVVVAIAATVLILLPRSTAYFAAVKASRARAS